MSQKAVLKAIERNAAGKRRSLKLNNRGLTTVPDELIALWHLEDLELYRNRLSSLPPGFSGLTSLTHLDLSSNDFKEIPEQLLDLTALESLLMSDSAIAAIPQHIDQLVNLRTLALDGPIESISPALGSLVLLESLELSALGDLPDELGNLINLRFLNLSDSSFDRFPEWITRLERLEMLVLRGCGLTEIPDTIRNLQNLESIDLSGNDLSSVPDALFDIPSLRGLDLHDNPNLPILDLPLDRLPNLMDASQGALGEWFFGPGDDGDLEVLEDPEHDESFLERAFFVGEDRGFIGLMRKDRSGWLTGSPDGETWTKVAPPELETAADAFVSALWHTGEWWVTLISTPSTDRARATDPTIALSRDATSWQVLDLSAHLREDEGLSIWGVAVSGTTLVATGLRTPRSGREAAMLLVGPIAGPLHDVKAPLAHVGDVVARPGGFVIACPIQRGGERTRLFDSVDGDRWNEMDPLDGYRSLYRVGDVLLAEGSGELHRSTDWGRTWSAGAIDFGVRDRVVMYSSVGPAGLAFEVFGFAGDRMETAVWFSADGRRFSRIHAEDPRNQQFHTEPLAVADDHVLLRRRDVDGDGPTEWIRVPTAGR